MKSGNPRCRCAAPRFVECGLPTEPLRTSHDAARIHRLHRDVSRRRQYRYPAHGALDRRRGIGRCARRCGARALRRARLRRPDLPSQAELVSPAARGRAALERARRLAVAAAPMVRAEWLARGRDLASRSYWALRRLRGARGVPVRYRAGDALVLLDATWTPDVRAELARARTEGACVCTVIYDLIKLRRPDLVSPGAARIYRRWLERVLPLSDVIATISQAVRDDVVAFLRESGRAALASKVRSFPLGSDFRGNGDGGKPTAGVAAALSGDRASTFLAVGSLEPRKDQATILAAFERLWRDGVHARLVLVGRPGWGSDALARRLAAHEARGTRLFWLADASDADLLHCYRQCACARQCVALRGVRIAPGRGTSPRHCASSRATFPSFARSRQGRRSSCRRAMRNGSRRRSPRSCASRRGMATDAGQTRRRGTIRRARCSACSTSRLAVGRELRRARRPSPRSESSTGSPICSARQYISASVSTSTASASAARAIARRDHAVVGEQARVAARKRGERVVGQRLRAERRVRRAPDVAAARDRDHVVERGNAAMQAGERRGERRVRVHDRMRVARAAQ